jgi:hypothetical protein
LGNISGNIFSRTSRQVSINQWVLMGTLGGLELLGFIGIFVGPVVLALAGELWRERTRNVERDHTPQALIETPQAASHPLANSAGGHAGRT